MTPAVFESNIPAALRKLNRWIGWGPDPADKTRQKCPLLLHNRTRRASSRKPSSWNDWSFALHFWTKYGQPKEDGTPTGYGVGFVFAPGDDLVYLDLDDAVDETGALRGWARPLVEPFFNKAYVELSPSGRGLHVIARGTLPVDEGQDICGGERSFPEAASDWAKSCKPKARKPEIAIFSSGKYTTISGDVIDAGKSFGLDCTVEIAQVWVAAGIKAKEGTRATGPVPDLDQLPAVDPKKIPKAVKEELEACTVGDAPNRSDARFAFYSKAAGHLEPEELFALVMAHEDWYSSSGAAEKGAAHTWKDICRSCSKVETAKEAFAEFKAEEEEAQEAALVTWKDLGLPVIERAVKDGTVSEVVHGVRAMVLTLTRHPEWKERIWRNQMSQAVMCGDTPMGEGVSEIAEWLRAFFRWEAEPNHEMVRAAIGEVAEAIQKNPLAEELKALKWDGTLRIDDWLVKAGCEDTQLCRQIGRKWLISLVARALQPGCKVDTVLILEGEQGKRKSALFEALAGRQYFTESTTAFEKDDKLVMHRRWIVELSELASFKKAATETVKKFLSTPCDDFRPPFGRAVKSFARHFVIVGTTNDDAYLEDTTGNRRYWPVRVVGRLDDAWVREAREQLLAEAVAAFLADEPWWWDRDPKDLVIAQEARVLPDSLDGVVADAVQRLIVDSKPQTFRFDALLEAIGVPIDRKDLSLRVAKTLRVMGCKPLGQRRVAGNMGRASFWRAPSPSDQAAGGEMADLIELPARRGSDRRDSKDSGNSENGAAE